MFNPAFGKVFDPWGFISAGGAPAVESSLGTLNVASLINSNCATFDGSNDYIHLPWAFNATSSYQISVWVLCESTTNYMNILDMRDDAFDGAVLLLNQGVADTFRWDHNSSVMVSENTYDDGNWYKITVEWDGSRVTMRIWNSSLVLLETVTAEDTSSISTTSLAKIGTRSYSTLANYLDGKMAGLSVHTDGTLKAAYSMAEGSGTKLYDSSGNNFTGNAQNVSEPAFWAATQNNTHANVLNGFAQIATFDQGQGGVDSGVVPDSGGGYVEFSFVHIDTASNQAVFGSRSTASDGYLLLFADPSNNLAVHYKDGTRIIDLAGYLQDGKTYTGTFSWSGNDVTLVVNGNTYKATHSGGVFTTHSMGIGARNAGGTLDIPTDASIKYVNLFNSIGVMTATSRSHAGLRRNVNTDIDLVMAAGQSQMLGRGEVNSSQTPPAGTAFDFNHLDAELSIAALEDPSGFGLNASTDGSPLPAFASEYVSRTGRKIVMVQTSIGATAQHADSDNGSGNWDDSGALYQAAVDKTWRAISQLQSLGYNVNFRGIIWEQGLRDAQEVDLATITIAQYKSAAQNMFDKFRNEFGNIGVVIGETGVLESGDTAGQVAVRTAQNELVDENSWMLMGFTRGLGWLNNSTYVQGDGHYTTAGYDILGEDMATVFANAFDGVTFPSSLSNPHGGHNNAESQVNFANDASNAALTIYEGHGEFNNTSSVINCGNDSSLQITGAITLAAYIRTTATAAQANGIIGKSDSTGNNRGYLLYVPSSAPSKASGVISTDGINSVVATGTTDINNGEWHHVAMVFEPSTALRLYVDGVLEGNNTTSIPATIFNTTENLAIGDFNPTEGTLFDGEIKQAHVYNIALSASGVAALMAGNTPLTGLVSRWPLISNALDVAGSNNGTATDVTFSTVTLPTAYSFGTALPDGLTKEVSVNKETFKATNVVV